MNIDKFKVEYWLNPYDPLAKYNLGSSCCKPFTVKEMLEFTGTDPKEFYDEINEMSLHYGYFEGMPRLKKAIANLYTDVVTEDMILSVHGGTGANSIVCYTLCEPGDNVVSVLPNYQMFYSIPEFLGIEVRQVHADASADWKIDFDAMEKLVDENTKMISLASPNNPTGYTLSKEDMERLAEIARKVDAYVVVDEIYRGLGEGYMHSIVDIYEKGICTFGTSKVFSCAGTRVGWIITRDMSIFDALHNFRSYNSICEGPINELITAIILENADKVYARNRAIVEEGRAALEEWVAENPHFSIACDSLSSTSLLVYDFDIPAEEFAQGLFDEKGTLVCHGMCFELEHSFRIGYGFGDVDYFKAGLAQIAEYVSDLEKAGRI